MAFCAHCGQQVTDIGNFCQHCGKSKPGTSAVEGGTAVVAVQKTETEKTFLSTTGATVTNTRMIVPGKTFAMAGITSVRSTVVEPSRAFPILVAIVGIGFLMARQFGLGILLLAGGVIWAIMLKDEHAVSINSASGEIQAVVSKDEKYIASIVQAINEAIVYRN